MYRLTCDMCQEGGVEADDDTSDITVSTPVHQSTQNDRQQDTFPNLVTCLDCGTELFTQDGILLVSRPNLDWSFTCPMCLRLLARNTSGSQQDSLRPRSPTALDISAFIVESSSDLHLPISDLSSMAVEETSTPSSQLSAPALDSAYQAEEENHPASRTDGTNPLSPPAFLPGSEEIICADRAACMISRSETTEQATSVHDSVEPDLDVHTENSQPITDSHAMGRVDDHPTTRPQITEIAEPLLALDDASAVKRISKAHEGVTTPAEKVEAGHSQSHTQDSFENSPDPFGPIIVISHRNGITSALDMISPTTSNVFDNDAQSCGEWSDTDDESCDVASTISSVSIGYAHRPIDQDAKDLACDMSRMSLSPRPVARRVAEVSGDTLI